MGDLPPYAKVLKERQASPSNFDRNSPTGNGSFAADFAYGSPFNYSAGLMNRSADIGNLSQQVQISHEVEFMRRENQELIHKLKEMAYLRQTDQQYITELETRLQNERQVNISISQIIQQLRDSYSAEKEKNHSLLEQINQLDRFLNNYRQIIETRENIALKLREEYAALLEDYHRSAATISHQAFQIQKARQTIKMLEDDIEELRKSTVIGRSGLRDSLRLDSLGDPLDNKFGIGARTPNPPRLPPPSPFEDNSGDTVPVPKLELDSPDDLTDKRNLPLSPDGSFTPNAKSAPFREQPARNHIGRQSGPSPERMRSVNVGVFSPLRRTGKSVPPFATDEKNWN